MGQSVENFGSNISFQPQCIYSPQNVEELLQIMGNHPEANFRAIGSLHSWSDVIQTTGILLSLKNFNNVELTKKNTVIVGGGCQVKHLLAELALRKKTLPSVGLIAEQTIAGATATGTHGSGRNSLSHYIQSVTIAHFDAVGTPVVTTIDSGPDLMAARCSLGLMGVIIQIEFEIRSEYSIEENARRHDSLESVLNEEPEYPLQQFYLMPWSWAYFAHHRRESTVTASPFAWTYAIYRFIIVDVTLHLVVIFMAKFFRFQWAVRLFYRALLPFTIIRNWRVANQSTKQLVMKHHWFKHIEIELFVTRDKLAPAIDFLKEALELIADEKRDPSSLFESLIKDTGLQERFQKNRGKYFHHFPICVRRILEDETLVSMTCSNSSDDQPSNDQCSDWYAISLVSFNRTADRDGFEAFANFIGLCFARLFGGRCHWGKYNRLDYQTNSKLYPQIDTFREVVKKFDPNGRFRNQWLEQAVGLKSN